MVQYIVIILLIIIIFGLMWLIHYDKNEFKKISKEIKEVEDFENQFIKTLYFKENNEKSNEVLNKK